MDEKNLPKSAKKCQKEPKFDFPRRHVAHTYLDPYLPGKKIASHKCYTTFEA